MGVVFPTEVTNTWFCDVSSQQMLHRFINLLVSLVLYVTPPPPQEVLRFCSLYLVF